MKNIRRWFENDQMNNGQDYEIYEYEGGIEARICSDCVCIDLEEVISGYGVDLEEVFPRSKYTH